ncbi:MAG: alpha/beta fold hydrolase [Clostridia bacterium]|nr:alpha/beta fold hydrolase [Clostridia bacterium]
MAHKTYINELKGSNTAILFIHGILGSPRHFEKFVSAVKDKVSVYNILLKGHGGSVVDFANTSMEAWKNQVADVAKYLTGKYDNIYIVAHSMGTFFAIENAINYPNKVKGLMLMQTPLKIGVKASAVVNTVKTLFDYDDEITAVYKTMNSINLSSHLWEYVDWVPRYVELFRESKRMRGVINNLETKTVIFQSVKDELVSMKSVDYIPKKENIKLNVLENSAHFIYDENEWGCMQQELVNMIK